MNDVAGAIDALVANLGATLTDPSALHAMAVAVLAGAVIFLVGRFIALRVGILARDAPDGETLGVGLSTGLLVSAATLATVASSARSAFTPVAVAFVVAVLLALRSHQPRRKGSTSTPRSARRLPLAPASILGAAAFLVGVGLLFALTMAPSPRAGVQPVEFMDEAFYSILGRDIVASGVEAFYSPSGFGVPVGFPAQNWYHWGELWLAGGAGMVGIEATFARHLVVLPMLLLASAATIGSIARRAIGTRARGVFVLGAAVGLLLAPIPLPDTGNYFTSWASGLLFSITMYGLAAVLVPLLMLLVLRGRAIPGNRPGTALFVAALTAALLPVHVAMALLAAAGTTVALAFLAVQVRLQTSRLPRTSRVQLVVSAWVAAMVVLTVGWGTFTGHRVIGSGSSPLIASFNSVWVGAMLATALGALALMSIPVAWVLVRNRRHELATMLLAVTAIVGGGAVAWGARMGEFTMFHVFFGAIAVFATPMAAAAILVVWRRLREGGHRLGALALVAVVVLQVELGIISSGTRIVQFSPRDYPAIPTEVLAAVEALEPGAKIGYACRQQEEIAYWDGRLLSIDLHTGRRVVPLCYEADFLAPYIGADGPTDTVSPQFPVAPQFELFPTAAARPTPQEVMAFMKREGIGYMYVDEVHPNTLVPEATPIVVSGSTQLLRLP